MENKIFKTVKYSPITKSRAFILMPWIGLNDKELFNKYKSYNTGVNIVADDTNVMKTAYSVCSGVVLCISKYKNSMSGEESYTTIIQYDATQCIKYVGLDTVEVSSGNILIKGDSIGTYRDYIHFEYITLSIPIVSENKGIYPTRLFGTTYYAEDPIKLVTGELDLDADSVISESYITPLLHTDYSEG